MEEIDLNDLDELYTTLLVTIAGNAEQNEGTKADKMVIYFGDLYARIIKHFGLSEAQSFLNFIDQLMDDARARK